jgi:hypothetical protein
MCVMLYSIAPSAAEESAQSDFPHSLLELCTSIHRGDDQRGHVLPRQFGGVLPFRNDRPAAERRTVSLDKRRAFTLTPRHRDNRQSGFNALLLLMQHPLPKVDQYG